MRAMGPGSLSSLLKIAMDVAYLAAWLFLGVTVLASLALLVIPLPTLVTTATVAGSAREVEIGKDLIFFSVACLAVYLGGLLAILHRLRRVFATLTSGDPFHPDNVRRLREIGLALGGLAIAQIGYRTIGAMLAPGVIRIEGVTNPTPWFSVLVVFVLAEVFREGARLRRESELTI